MMVHFCILVTVTCFAWLSVACPVSGYDSCRPVSQVVCQTVYEPRPVTVYRLMYETILEERQVTSYRPVWETQTRERRYTVARPVMETSTREQRFRVRRPVRETQMRDTSYDRVQYVAETQMREQRVIVNRPVWETRQQERRYVVRKPVTETITQDRHYTTMQPVTTMHTQVVDQGQYVDQSYYQPGPIVRRLRWLQGHRFTDPATGVTRWRGACLYWVPVQRSGRHVVQRAWVPNYVTRQVPQTTYVPKSAVQQVPVQVTRYQDEVVTDTVPVRVCRMEQTEVVQQVPHTVYRQVVERIQQQTPVQVCRWVEEEVVRHLPVTTTRYEYEQRVEQVSVRVCNMVTFQETVRVPRTRAKWVPVTYTRMVPRTVMMRGPRRPSTTDVAGSGQQPATVLGKPAQNPVEGNEDDADQAADDDLGAEKVEDNLDLEKASFGN